MEFSECSQTGLNMMIEISLKILFWCAIFCTVYVYFLYPVLIWIISLFIRKHIDKTLNNEDLPQVSLIIAAYNETDHIERKILNCLSLDYPKDKIEIVIGSDGSDDGTNEIIDSYVAKGVNFFPHEKRRGKMAVVNDGVKVATGEICIFTDVAELLEHDAVKKLVRNFANKNIGAVTGNHIYNFSDSELGKWTVLYWKYQRFLQRVESRVSTIFSCDGTIYACRKKLYIPPPEETINDDKAVPLGIVRQGYRIVFEPEAVARGDTLTETSSFYNQKRRSQAGMYQLLWMFKDMMFRIRSKRTWFMFMSHTVGPLVVPWMLAIILIINLCLYNVFPYSIFLIIQIVFYLSVIAGGYAHKHNYYVPLLYILYFFVLSNYASLAAFFLFLKGSQNVTWDKVK